MPDTKEGADPNCPDCKGTGVIILLKFSVPCDCLKKSVETEEIDYNDPELNTFLFRHAFVGIRKYG